MPDLDLAALSLQQRYAPMSICYGCGPANERGLHIASFPAPGDRKAPRDAKAPGDGDGQGEGAGATVVCEFTPEPHHQAFPGVLNGGIIGTLMDCHSNWAAAYGLMLRTGSDTPPTTVTAEFAVRLLHPTPIAGPLRVTARVVESTDDRATTEATLEAGGRVTATCRGTFVAVRPGHPAYHRW